jgi:hypothetical protein
MLKAPNRCEDRDVVVFLGINRQDVEHKGAT